MEMVSYKLLTTINKHRFLLTCGPGPSTNNLNISFKVQHVTSRLFLLHKMIKALFTWFILNVLLVG